jgi:hypothetical protein
VLGRLVSNDMRGASTVLRCLARFVGPESRIAESKPFPHFALIQDQRLKPTRTLHGRVFNLQIFNLLFSVSLSLPLSRSLSLLTLKPYLGGPSTSWAPISGMLPLEKEVVQVAVGWSIMRMDLEVRLPRKLISSWVYHQRPNGGTVMHFGRSLKRDILQIELSLDHPQAVFPDAV